MTSIRDWKIFVWALMHSPETCEIELKVVDFWFDSWGDDPAIISFTVAVCFPPQICLHIPHETRSLYAIKVEGAEPPDVDDIPF